MIISVRGANGSGKSTVVFKILRSGTNKPLYGMLGAKQPEAHELILPKVKKPVYVLGPYEEDGLTGGCDRIHNIVTKPHGRTRSGDLFQPSDGYSVEDLIRKYAGKGHVLFEGVVVSTMYGGIGKLMEKWGKESVFMFLDTPLEECLRRVELRRGRVRDERLIRKVTFKHEFGMRVKSWVERDDIMQSIMVSPDDAPDLILSMLRG